MITSEVTANAEQKKNDWKLWELVNMGVVLPQPQSLWEDGYGRGLTKGGGKLGPPAFFSFEAVTTQKRALTQSGLDLPAAHRARQSRTQGVAVTTWVVFFFFSFFSLRTIGSCVSYRHEGLCAFKDFAFSGDFCDSGFSCYKSRCNRW